MSSNAVDGTFASNRSEPIHRWYPYIEGYSSNLVERELDMLSLEKGATVYDPFGGTGTTPLSSCMRGYNGLYSETNPFMRFVIETKTNCVRRLGRNASSITQLKMTLSNLSKNISRVDIGIENVDILPFAKYFDEQALHTILRIKTVISRIEDRDIQQLFKLAFSSILVPVSKMIRRGDLRFAREQELTKKQLDVELAFFEKSKEIIFDIEEYGSQLSGSSKCISADVRDIENYSDIDCIITSPPYLNGTNYIRNTKLELFLNDYVSEDHGLSELHSKGIVAGINNVSKQTAIDNCMEMVSEYYDALIPVAYDKRIPTMVACYFADMDSALKKMSHALVNHGMLIMDIGDSQFAGIHIPTHEILASLAESHGLALIDNEILRTRRSKSGFALTQRILRFKLERAI